MVIVGNISEQTVREVAVPPFPAPTASPLPTMGSVKNLVQKVKVRDYVKPMQQK